MEFLAAIVGSIIGKIAGCTIEPNGRQFGYLFYYESNINNLKTQFQHLKDTKQDLQHTLDVATRRGEEIKQSIKNWLSQIDSISEMVENFLSDHEGQANTGCSIKSFPNLVLRHRLSRRAKKMAQSVVEIKEAASKFGKVSNVPILQNILETKGYMAFHTRNSILKGIMEALRNNDIRMIGVYGMAGVGKTTLAKEVAKRALEAKLFNDAVEVAVSAFPKLEKIQQEIADRLGLKFDEDGVKARAVRLRHRLRTEEKFLIILDDVWKKLDLLDIGICFEDVQKGCKILITSRYQGVLEDDMDVDKNFKVELLSDSEAWSFFSKMVGDNLLSDENSDEFKHLTTQIVKECACLPLAIMTVAHALKNKGIHFWKDALRRLRRSSMDEKVYSSVKLSYDFLENGEARLILLFCSLYEEDAEISINDLLNLCVGWDLFKDVYTLEESRNRLQTLLDELKSRCLLLKGNERDLVKMHDVIHDVGISIAASEDFKMYNIRSNDELKKYLEDSNKLKDSIAISLGATVEHQFLPSSLNCAELRLLSMAREHCSLPDNFFEETKELRVLNLSFLSLETFPSSFLCLENLQVLHLFRVEIEDIHMIGELKKLKVLDLGGSQMKKLPEQIGQLTRLCKLDLSNCYNLKVVPPNVISRLVNLEELNMLHSFNNWKAEGEVFDENTSSSASLTEVKNLTRLTALYLEVPHVNMLPKDLFSTKLERYYIPLGGWGVDIMEGSRGLRLNLEFDTRRLLKECGFQMLLKRSENLHLERFHGLKNIVCDLDKEGGLSHLKALKVNGNHEIQYIIDSSPMELNRLSDHSVLPSLETFEFVGMENLEKICHGELKGAKSLRKLRQANVDLCKKLKNLLPFFIANNLEKIKIFHCLQMEEIVTLDSQDVINFEAVDRIEFPNLKYMQLWNLPQLTRFCSETDTSIGKPDQGQEGKEQLYHSDSSTTLFNQKVALPSLEVLDLGGLQFKRIWADQLPQTCQNLRELSVYWCNSLKYLLSFAIARYLVQLEKLIVEECDDMGKIIIIKKPTVTLDNSDDQLDIIEFPELKIIHLRYLPQIIQFCSQSCEGQGSDYEQVLLADSACSLFNEMVAFPSLEQLFLWNLKSVKRIWPNQLPETCKMHNLKTLHLRCCKSLKYVLPFAIAESLVQLEKLIISQCEGLEEIIMIKESKEEVEKIDKMLLSKLEYVDLKNLPNLTRFCSIETNICGLNFIPVVYISDCPKLFSRTAKEEEDKHMDLQEKISMRSPCADKKG
nr:probable disease resistance protein At4g27220 isoform X1 [Ziziphus jujuba var. spinosa]